ncbi:hypothetical protein MRX96_004099 [Rhipicephalus microplus]
MAGRTPCLDTIVPATEKVDTSPRFVRMWHSCNSRRDIEFLTFGVAVTCWSDASRKEKLRECRTRCRRPCGMSMYAANIFGSDYKDAEPHEIYVVLLLGSYRRKIIESRPMLTVRELCASAITSAEPPKLCGVSAQGGVPGRYRRYFREFHKPEGFPRVT